ncbi:TIGR03000 domain-containing protein [Urbifossiella limnaea]|uniref:Uncharacterized protein n=1 Tax=Urbifossiella limnaea TaxID=2528023 RepID=A0A517Y0C8_9BACT|nr:TIGR03000 domain-containing protein [Urbifossiella limnaea]QDU23212.1 hypothetical protein ETAA1_52040 [Urbifossiella limnaea]
MRRALFAAVLAVAASAAPAKAWDWPTATSATFPLLTPSGYYTNTYYYGWAYPWFAYYNYAHGPYANWASYGPYATYGWGCYGCRGYADPFAGTGAATLVVDLPESAVLKFNGVSSPTTGNSRTYSVPALSYGQDYGYELVAEVTANGKTTRAAAKVVLRAGETARVTLNPK